MLGSYRLVAELGHGGMADVFLAASEGPAGSGFTKLAVVKRLRPNLADDPAFVSMLMDEARITARLSHPNVVQLFEAGHGQDDEFFLAMEYLDGQPLYRLERRAKRLGIEVPRELYYAIVADLLAGLHHAHELTDYDGSSLDIVHRDVTPHNIFVTYDGVVKVVDFGIAKAMGRSTETKHGVVKGKVRYMSPEQALSGEVDRRTDIFAAGVILWNAATGLRFWGELDDLAVVSALVSGSFPTSPRTVDPSVPEAIDTICKRALAFRPEDRFVTASEMRAKLEAFLGQRSAFVRRDLQSMMKELFAKERASLRGVLEAAGLTSAASVNAFTAGAAAQRADEIMPLSASGPEEAGQYTLVMPDAPPRMAVVRDAPRPVLNAPGPPPVVASARVVQPKKRSWIVLGVLIVATAAVVLAVVALAREQGVTLRSTSAPRAERASEVAPSSVTFDGTVRAKAVNAKAENDDVDAGSAKGRPSGSRRSPPPEGPREAQQPPPAPVPDIAATTRTPPKGTKIDRADPWNQ
jgi:serine/threonine-protein kinase